MEATNFYFKGKRVYVGDDVPKSTIYTLNTNDIRIEPMKNDWSKVNEAFDSMDADLERIESLVWGACAVGLGMITAVITIVVWNW
jgi:hypothetical protein